MPLFKDCGPLPGTVAGNLSSSCKITGLVSWPEPGGGELELFTVIETGADVLLAPLESVTNAVETCGVGQCRGVQLHAIRRCMDSRADVNPVDLELYAGDGQA